MVTPPDETTTDPNAVIAALRTERDALAEALARRNSEYSERIDHQAATIDVLKAMSASPGDAQPVFDLIAQRVRTVCGEGHSAVAEFDGKLLHLRANSGNSDEIASLFAASYPQPLRPNLMLSRPILTHDAVLVDDLWADPDYALSGLARSAGWRSVMSVPILRGGMPIGAIAHARSKPGAFPAGEVELLRTFAEQAAIAITSADTYRALHGRTRDLQEALEQQTATAEVLQVINSAPGDLAPVFDTMLDKAMRLCSIAFGMMTTFDGERFHPVCWRGLPTALSQYFAEGGGPSGSSGMHAQLVGGAPLVHVADMKDEEAYRSGYPARRALVDLGGARTGLAIPLRKEGMLLGTFMLYRQEVRSFSDQEIALLQSFASQAVIAMENARLITEQREALEQQTATAEVLGVINANPGDLTPVFDAILEKAHSLCGAPMGSLMIYDGRYFRAVATHGFPEQHAALIRQPFLPLIHTGALVTGERFVHVADIQEGATRSDHDVARSTRDASNMRTALYVALRKEGVLLGCISASRPEVRPFSDKQIALLENFAAQAVIAMENARLLTETREALEQQTATAEVLEVINASPGNLAPVYDAMLEKAMHLCGAVFGSLTASDGQYANVLAMRGFPPALSQYMEARDPRAAIAPAIVQLAKTKRPQQIADVMAGEGYRSGHPVARAVADLGGARTMLHVPLRKDEAMLGYISVYRQEVRAFTDKQIALLENFAAQAVIAMENARLIDEQREALEQQTATAEVLQVINSSPGDLRPVFDAMLEKALRLCEAAYGQFATYDGEFFRFVAKHGTVSFLRQHPTEPLRPSDAVTWQRIVRGEPLVHIPDLADTDLYRSGHEVAQAIVDIGGGRTLLTVALRKDDALLGALTVYRQEVKPFTDKQIALLQNFAAQAVIAMENARLISETREALERQTATAEVLQVINASPGRLEPVFTAMLEKAKRLTQSEFSSLATYDGSVFHLFSDDQSQPEIVIESAGALHDLVCGATFVHIPDVADTDAYRARLPGRVLLVERFGARTCLWIPLRRDGTLLGALAAWRREVRPFSDKEIALLENFAAQAVIAMDNARLLNEVRQRQEELRITFENMGDGVALFDETQHLVAWNGKFQEIQDLPDALLEQHRTYEELLHFLAARGDFGPGVDTVEQINGLVARTGKPYGYERTRPDGRVIEIRRNPVPDGGFVFLYSDITERKRSEEEIRAARDAAETALRELKTAQANLVQAEKMASLGQLTAGIAHEIKNPLNFVNNFASLSVDLLDELKQTAAPGFAMLDEAIRAEIDDLTRTLSGNLEKINEHGQRADGIVRSMLEHSRGTSGERRSVNLNTLVDEALNLAYHGARAQDQSFGITLQRDFGSDIAQIELTPQDMTRVLLNLFGNGFYATRRRQNNAAEPGFEPTLKVTTRDLGDAVEIRVRDNGIGVPAEIRDKLFQPFFTTKPTGEGTGLGLSISYDIVTKQHGGMITVESEVGQYSEFTMRLPRNS